MGLREAHEHHLPGITLAAPRYARTNNPTFPRSVDKRGAEFLYRPSDLKRWARNRPRADSGTTAWTDHTCWAAEGCNPAVSGPASVEPRVRRPAGVAGEGSTGTDGARHGARRIRRLQGRSTRRERAPWRTGRGGRMVPSDEASGACW
ncbi:hypothetical protein [Streptomyces natalensis]|uniref:hypothetical protein n=1 Tax=Streptomyces natalensis TaxID=68242 RepID=UPI0004AAEB01|nr:hypothetical protein [Streptomyces natalensis]